MPRSTPRFMLPIGSMAAALLMGFATVTSAFAQVPRRVTASTLAQVTFPFASFAWTGDPTDRRNTLFAAARQSARLCGSEEYFVWQTPNDSMADSTRTKTNAAFTAAGWTLTETKALPDGQHILLATRQQQELVLDWVPAETFIALLLCEVRK